MRARDELVIQLRSRIDRVEIDVAFVVDDPLPVGATCEHRRMDECCEGCGHYSCPDCGLTWDTFAEQ